MPVSRKVVQSCAALALSAASICVTTPKADAAISAPWRFTAWSAASTIIPGLGNTTVSATCAAGYTLVGGGFITNDPDFERVAEYRVGTDTYSVIIHNFQAQTIQVHAFPVCAWSDHVGTITVVSQDFSRNGDGDAGGTVTCPGGQKALFGGADWNDFNAGRRLDLTSPSADGNSWIAAGWSPQSGATLHVEAYCIAPSALGMASPAPLVQTEDHGGTGTFSHDATCPAGRRVVSGGAAAGPGSVPDPTTYRMDQVTSRGTTALTWRTTGRVSGGNRITYATWCIPASQPVVSISAGPPSRDNQTTVTFHHSATEPSGESPLQKRCFLDGAPPTSGDVVCGAESTTVSDVGAGQHTFTYYAKNQSDQVTTATWTWTVDLTPPTASVESNVPLSGPIALTFSEKVTGVSNSSVQVRVLGQPTPLAGTVVPDIPGTHATWTPTASLVPGERYVVSTTSAIEDVAGNALAATDHQVRAARSVQTSSLLVTETWDQDRSTSASGGGYATSRTAGSSATWRYTGVAGQRAVVYGVRRPNGGYADVYVDGVRKAKVSFYATSVRHKVPVFTSALLGGGTHTVEVRVLGTKPAAAKGTWVSLDYLRTGTTKRQETAARQRFRTVLAAPASDGSYETVTHQLSGDNGGSPAYSLVFRGTAVDLIGTRSPSSGTARVYVDGVLRTTVTFQAASTAYQVLVGSVTGLADIRHTLRVVPVGTASGTGSAVGLDRIDVDPVHS